MDQPITPLPVTPLAPKPDSAANPVLASSADGAGDASDPNSDAFKPQVFRRKSTNYEDAAKRASTSSTTIWENDPAAEVTGPAKTILDPQSVGSSGIEELAETDIKQKGPEDGVAGNWQPKIERKQSWDVQDWKHDLQKAVAEGERKGSDASTLGFTETGSSNTERYSQS